MERARGRGVLHLLPFVEVGSMENVYGRIYLRPNGHQAYEGNEVMLRMIVEECRIGDAPDGTWRRLSNAELLDGITRRLHGYGAWAWRGPEEPDDDEPDDDEDEDER